MTVSTPSEPRLRPATAGDLAFLRRVYAATRAEELQLTNWTQAQKAAFCDAQFAAQDAHYRAHYPGAEFQVIELRGEPVGRLYLHRSAEELRIMDLSLLPEWRGQGLGTHYLQLAQQWAAEEGRRVGIHVEQFNRARELYRRLGFQERHVSGIHLYLDWRPEVAA